MTNAMRREGVRRRFLPLPFTFLLCSALLFWGALGCTSGDEVLLSPDPKTKAAAKEGATPSLGDGDPLGNEAEVGVSAPTALEGKPKRVVIPQANDAGRAAADALPLPQTRTLFGVHGFLKEAEGAYRAYSSPLSEYRKQAALYASMHDPDDKDLEDLRTHVAENYGRSHWAFVFGVEELLKGLSERSPGEIAIDKERIFIERMRFLTFLAQELGALEKSKRHQDYVRMLYVETAERHFGRKLKTRKAPREANP